MKFSHQKFLIIKKIILLILLRKIKIHQYSKFQFQLVFDFLKMLYVLIQNYHFNQLILKYLLFQFLNFLYIYFYLILHDFFSSFLFCYYNQILQNTIYVFYYINLNILLNKESILNLMEYLKFNFINSYLIFLYNHFNLINFTNHYLYKLNYLFQ